MNLKEFRVRGHQMVDWMADYLENVRDYPVKSAVTPGDIFGQVPANPPEAAENFDDIFADFQEIIIPGITHWQHPSFFAYFPANSSPPSVLAEMLTATLGTQCMIWQTSPAAAELEEKMMLWLARMIGMPAGFTGVIQDTASTATLCSILTAREKFSDYGINRNGIEQAGRYTVYCSTETHSSIEKAVKIAGLGSRSIRKIPVDDKFALDPTELEKKITRDLQSGHKPLCAIATMGTTGSTAIDPIAAIGEICRRYSIWLHVDAAYAGTALVLPDKRWMAEGVELADTFVFNPHKWMLTNFDCSAYFVRDREALIRTFEILPEYLKTRESAPVNNYRDWGIPLGRRFRALKLWFVIRTYGVTGIQNIIRSHIDMIQDLARKIEASDDFELLAPVPLNLVCFRYHPKGIDDKERLNSLNESLLNKLNATGKMYLTHTRLNENYTIRLVAGQTGVSKADIDNAWELIRQMASEMSQ